MSGISPMQPQHEKRQIILNADDYGPSKFCNDGIIKGIRNGGINSVSVFVTFGPECLDNIKKLQETIKEVGRPVKIGLHFTTTAGKPVADRERVSTLCFKAKDRWNYNQWMFKNPGRIKIKHYWASHMIIELRAQLELLRKTLDLPSISDIDHINNHLGLVHFNYTYWKIYTDVANEYGIPVRNPIPYNSIGGSIILTNGKRKMIPADKDGAAMLGNIITEGHVKDALRLFKGTRKKHLKKRREEALKKGVKLPSYFLVHYYKQPTKEKIHHFLGQLKTGETAEFMFHLGLGSYRNERHWGIQYHSYQHRQKELTELMASNILQEMNTRGIDLVNYGNLKK